MSILQKDYQIKQMTTIPADLLIPDPSLTCALSVTPSYSIFGLTLPGKLAGLFVDTRDTMVTYYPFGFKQASDDLSVTLLNAAEVLPEDEKKPLNARAQTIVDLTLIKALAYRRQFYDKREERVAVNVTKTTDGMSKEIRVLELLGQNFFPETYKKLKESVQLAVDPVRLPDIYVPSKAELEETKKLAEKYAL